MKEYLVESHMDGYYVSSMDYETITSYCETCGDSDTIIASWDGEENKYNAIVNLVVNTYFLNKDDIKKCVCELHDCYDLNLSEFLDEYKYIRYSIKKDMESFIRCLYEDEIVNNIECKNLLTINTKLYNKETKLTNNIDFTYLEKGKIKKKVKHK